MPTLDSEVVIPVDGGAIAGTWVTPGTLIPGVLFVHGWGGSQAQYLARAREIAALGCVCLTFDLRGHAGTRPQFESVSRESNLRDVLAAYHLLASHPSVDPTAMALVGSSYGGYLAAIVSSMRPVRWLALRAPALYRDSGWEIPKLRLHQDQDLHTYRRSLVPADGNRALSACRDFRGDILLIESEHDDIVPPTVLASYREAAKEARSLTYRRIEGADHGLTQAQCQQAYTTLLANWLKEMVIGARSGTVSRPGDEPAVVPETPRSPAA